MMSRPAVRRAGVADVDRIAPLFSAYLVFYGQAHDAAAAAEFMRARLEREEAVVFLAETADGAAVGFAQVYPTFDSIGLTRAWRLNDLYVEEVARRSGAGTALLQAVAAAAVDAGVAWIDLETAHDNVRARRLYERERYELDEVYAHYVREL